LIAEPRTDLRGSIRFRRWWLLSVRCPAGIRTIRTSAC